jgi:molybdopterin biosynthesis enzyme MoaB
MQYKPGIALMTISREYVGDDPATTLVDARLRTADARVAARAWVPATVADVRAQLVTWISAPAIDAVIVCSDGTDVAATALQPLVTEAVHGGALCGKKLVFVMPATLAGTSDTFDRIVFPALASRARPERIETDKIAVIGDLPSVAEPVVLNLRTGGRRGLQMVGLAGVAVAGALCALAVNVLGRHDTIAIHHGAADEVAAETPAVQPLPRPTLAAPTTRVVAASRPAPVTVTPRHKLREEPRHIAHPKPKVTVPAALELTPAVEADEDDDDTCSEESCARHGNERECCTPYRTQAISLDRTHIARVTAGLEAQVHACGSTGGVVRVSVHVAADGSVDKALVLEAPEVGVGSCVAQVLRDASFSATVNGGSFVYKIDLAD